MTAAPGGADGIQRLIQVMARLPGLGPRSARRAVLALIRRREALMLPLAEALADVVATARHCAVCGTVDTAEICAICADPARAGTICVVEGVGDLWALERTGVFRGRYHVLGGLLSALDGVDPAHLRIPELAARVRAEDVAEVILALPQTVDGQTTAHYVADALDGLGVTVTRLGQGVPVGGELDYLDDGTIAAALGARRRF